MVDYLCRAGIVIPSVRPNPGHGRSRLYGFGDLVLLRAMKRLLDAGLPVSRLKKALETQQKKFANLGPNTEIAKYLITDGRNVLLANEASSFIELNKEGQIAFAFIVDVDQARTEVSAGIEKLGRRKAEFPKSIRRRVAKHGRGKSVSA